MAGHSRHEGYESMANMTSLQCLSFMDLNFKQLVPRECEKQNLLSLVEKEVLHYGTGDTDATLELPSARHGQLRTSYCKRALGMCTAGGGGLARNGWA